MSEEQAIAAFDAAGRAGKVRAYRAGDAVFDAYAAWFFGRSPGLRFISQEAVNAGASLCFGGHPVFNDAQLPPDAVVADQ